MINILIAIGSIGAAVILIKIWTGAMHVKAIDEEPIANIEKRQPYLPKMGAIAISVLIAGSLFMLSLQEYITCIVHRNVVFVPITFCFLRNHWVWNV